MGGGIVKKNQVILFYGLPASGKYTVAKEIQKKCGGVLLDNHYFYDLFVGITEVPDEIRHEWFHRVGDVRRAYMDVLRKFYPRKKRTRFIFTSVLFRGEKLPANLQKFAHDIDADFIPIELNVRKDVLLKRCNTAQRKKREKISDPKEYEKVLNKWLPNAFHSRHANRLVIDVSDLSLDKTVAAVRKHLRQFD